jgi:hypothetical protein
MSATKPQAPDIPAIAVVPKLLRQSTNNVNSGDAAIAVGAKRARSSEYNLDPDEPLVSISAHNARSSKYNIDFRDAVSALSAGPSKDESWKPIISVSVQCPGLSEHRSHDFDMADTSDWDFGDNTSPMTYVAPPLPGSSQDKRIVVPSCPMLEKVGAVWQTAGVHALALSDEPLAQSLLSILHLISFSPPTGSSLRYRFGERKMDVLAL